MRWHVLRATRKKDSMTNEKSKYLPWYVIPLGMLLIILIVVGLRLCSDG